MSSNLPQEGMGLENDTTGLPTGDNQTVSNADKSRSTRHTARPRSVGRASQAINDAQQGLSSLLDSPAGDAQPRIISRSGASRNHTRGRVAGPTAPTALGPGHSAPAHSGQLIEGGAASQDTSLSLVPTGQSDLDWREVRRDSRIAPHLVRAGTQIQAARERASLLINGVDESYALGLGGDDGAAHTSHRAAAQWATRYATHLVIVLVVGALVAMGGLKSFTAQGAYPTGLHSVDAYSGTDHFEDDHELAADGQPDIDSLDFEIALPRTELGGSDAVANSKIRPSTPGQNYPDEGSSGSVMEYGVAAGDTLESIAAAHDLLPETVMGSNGIIDSDETLEEGRTLILPPVDGIYYVVAEGDTVETVADKFQVDPAVIISYPGNGILDETVSAGQPLIVPGGMIPARDMVVTYTVKRGDSLRDIAARFGVDVPTMLHSNAIDDPDNLQPGSELRVLPVPGIEYTVRKGDTIRAVAEKSGVSPQMILDYTPNNLRVDSQLKIDQVIVVPGGSPEVEIVAAARVQASSRGVERPVEKRPEVRPPPKATPKTSTTSAGKPVAKPQPKAEVKPPPKPVAKPKVENTRKAGTGRMVWPVRGTITQYFSGRHNGLDIAIRAGTPLHAADSGKVIWSGWRRDGLGYAVFIDHLNGITTVYGHMLRQPAVYVGQYVSRGQTIGLVGSTGRSTGPHVHFMVKTGVYRNPLAYLGR
ncbi:MAG: LysM peptidoglycan-binding domain-containing protein [Chloroflexia bacterium]